MYSKAFMMYNKMNLTSVITGAEALLHKLKRIAYEGKKVEKQL